MEPAEAKKTRRTKHQNAVLELLKDSKKALTADEIKAALEETINKTTIIEC